MKTVLTYPSAYRMLLLRQFFMNYDHDNLPKRYPVSQSFPFFIRDMGRLIRADMIAKGKIMPKKSSKTFVNNGWVNINIPADRTDEVVSYCDDKPSVLQEFIEILNAGYSISQWYDAKEGVYRTSAYCQDSESENHGYKLGSFANHPSDSLAVLLYKHFHIADCVWTSHKSDTTKRFG